MSNKIQISGNFTQVEHELGASGIYPGMLVMVNSDDEAVVHDTEGGFAEVLIALEDVYAGNTVDDVLTSGELEQFGIPQPGAVFQGLVESGQALEIGEKMISAGNGKFIAENAAASTDVVKQIVAICRETKTTLAADTLVKMRRV
jgi:hypothetical protein